MILFYIRHGAPTYNPDKLLPLGHSQAEALAKRLALFGVDEIYASSSTRAIETAEHTARLVNKEVIPLDWMHENLAGKELGIPLSDNKRLWSFVHPDYVPILASREVRDMGERWYEHPALADFHFERSMQRIGSEMDNWLASLGLEHDREKGMYRVTKDIKEKRVALFAHAGVGTAFMSQLLDIPYPLYATHFEMMHSAMTAIAFDEGSLDFYYPNITDYKGYALPRVLTLSNDSHLYREGLPLNHISCALRKYY